MIRLNYLLVAIAIIVTAPFTAISQSLSVNTDGSNAAASAMLDVKSTTKGLLIPRMSRTERDAIASPATGLLIFQNAPDSIGYYYYNGSAWTWLLSNSNADSLAWRTGGNSGTLPANNFIGTRDNVDLVIRTNNTEAVRVAANGAIGLGTNAPSTGPGVSSRIDIRDEGGGLSNISQLNAGAGVSLHNFIKQGGTLASPLAVGSSDYLGGITVNLYNGSSYATAANILVQADGTISATQAPGAISFWTRDTGSGAGISQRLIIKSYGNVGIGLNSPVASLDITGASTGTNSLQLRSGNSSSGFISNQVLFGWNGSAQYRHAIKTRHQSGSPNQNAIDFFLWNQGVDASTTVGTKAAMTIDGKYRGMVGIGTTTPNSELHISDGSASLKSVTDAGNYGASVLITDNNIPRIYLEAAGQPADQKMMDMRLFNQSIRFAALTDAGNAFTNSDILVINRGGNVGIGVNTPAVALDVNGSATIGTGNLNTGLKAINSGTGNNLSGNYSIVTGESNIVSSIRSMVSGTVNNVSGENNIVSGAFNQVVSPFGHSIVVGFQDTLNGSASAIFGFFNKVTGNTGFATGDRNTVAAQNGAAFGYLNTTTGISAFVTGVTDTASGNASAAFGSGNNAASFNEFALGMFGTGYTPVSTSVYDPADRIFNVGNGTSSAARADAFTILKGGNVGIGTANPTALLDINGNTLRLRTAKTPATSSDPGNTGDIAWDNDYIYVCVATNTWKRVFISNW